MDEQFGFRQEENPVNRFIAGIHPEIVVVFIPDIGFQYSFLFFGEKSHIQKVLPAAGIIDTGSVRLRTVSVQPAAKCAVFPADIPEIGLERFTLHRGMGKQERRSVPDLQHTPQERLAGKIPGGLIIK